MQARDGFIKDNIQAIGVDSFPDNTDVTWNIRRVWHEGDFSMVEAEPTPPTVGYPSFRFVLQFVGGASQGVVAGCYALTKAGWSLLFTAPGTGSQWQSMFASARAKP